ncbi:MAG TPA: FGGY family carbohydrate kinase, partial [Sporolactobacillaceae bacterium]|nr:FGGY family carbohydrate kinase [Sporolactobacillaceae bacterium]
MGLLGIDIGTTHTKVGLFDLEGRLIKMAVRPTESYLDPTGHVYLNADRLWETTITCIKEVVEKQDEDVSVIGIASMAETGLLIDRSTGLARTDLIPWYSRCAETEADLIASSDDLYERFKKSGLHASFKYGLAKLLWVKRQDPHLLQNAVWLSTADFIAFKLTGKMGTDYTLAARTFAFRLDEKRWDEEWIHSFGLLDSLFPEASPSGTCLGRVTREVGQHLGLVEGTPVAISGHDHVCAAFAVGATRSGVVFDSMGTAETLFGSLDERPLTRADFNTGLSYGCHVLKDHYFWLGGVQSSGGSVEWL